MSNRFLAALAVTVGIVLLLAWVVRADGATTLRDWFLQLHGR